MKFEKPENETHPNKFSDDIFALETNEEQNDRTRKIYRFNKWLNRFYLKNQLK